MQAKVVGKDGKSSVYARGRINLAQFAVDGDVVSKTVEVKLLKEVSRPAHSR